VTSTSLGSNFLGKFSHSKLHEAFSDWHYQKCKSNAFLCDVDRIWVELRNGKPIAVFDLKTETDKLTHVGNVLGKWFEEKDVPFYVVVIKTCGEEIGIRSFTIWRPKTDSFKEFTEEEMIQWINDDLKPER